MNQNIMIWNGEHINGRPMKVVTAFVTFFFFWTRRQLISSNWFKRHEPRTVADRIWSWFIFVWFENVVVRFRFASSLLDFDLASKMAKHYFVDWNLSCRLDFLHQSASIKMDSWSGQNDGGVPLALPKRCQNWKK